MNIPSTPPRLLILGGTGRLASLIRRVWQVAPPDLHPVWQCRPGHSERGGGDWVTLDPLGAPEALAAAVGASDAVLNLAGVVSGDGVALAANVTLARAVVRAARGRPVFLASSAAVYGRGHPPGGWSEAMRPVPVSAYGAAKLAMEHCARGPGVVALRIGNVAGADAVLGGAGRELDIFEDGLAPRRSYLTPQVLAGAIARLVGLTAAGHSLPTCLNLAQAGEVGMDDLLRAAGRSWRARPAARGAIAQVRMNVVRAQRLGLVPQAPASSGEIVAQLRRLAA